MRRPLFTSSRCTSIASCAAAARDRLSRRVLLGCVSCDLVTKRIAGIAIMAGAVLLGASLQDEERRDADADNRHDD